MLITQICVDFYRIEKCKISQEKKWDRTTESEKENNTLTGQNYLLLPFAPFLIRIKPTSLKPSRYKSQLNTDRGFLQTESCDLHQRLGGCCCTCHCQVYLYRHIMASPKDTIVCQWVRGWQSACMCQMTSAVTDTKLMGTL